MSIEIIHNTTTDVYEIEVSEVGAQGLPGKSAYQSYLDTTTDNPPLTEAEWSERAEGPQGPQGPVGPQGPKGDDGSSTAEDTTIPTGEFTKNLSDADTDVLKALKTIDGFDLGGNPEDTAYGPTWANNPNAASKNSLYNVIETITTGSGAPIGEISEGETRAVTGGKIYDALVDKVNIKTGSNLFDVDTTVYNEYVRNTGVISASTTYSHSAKIPVKSNTNYICNVRLRWTAYYDENENLVIGGSSVEIPPSTVITIPSNIHFIILTFYTDDNSDTLIFQEGSVLTGYEKYGRYIEQPILRDSDIVLKEDLNVLPESLQPFLVDAFFFNSADNSIVKGVKGNQIDLGDSLHPNFETTAKGVKLKKGMIVTPFMRNVKCVTILYKTNIKNTSNGFIIGGGLTDGQAITEGFAVAAEPPPKVLGTSMNWHEAIYRTDTGGSFFESQKGGWTTIHRTHTQNFNSVYCFGGRASTGTSLVDEMDISMVFFWNKDLTVDDLENLGTFIRSRAIKLDIRLTSDDCDVKHDLYLDMGASTLFGRSTMSNLSASDLALDLRHSLYVGQKGGGSGVQKMDKLEMGYNQQQDNLNHFGPEFGIAFRRRQRALSLGNATIMNLAQGGTHISPLNTSGNPNWNANTNVASGLLYKAASQIYFTMQESMTKGIGFNETIRVGFNMGLNDAVNDSYVTTAAAYQGYLQDFWDRLQSLFLDYNFEMALFRVHPFDPTSQPSALAKIRQANEDFATANANVTMYSMDDFTFEADGVHPDAASSKEMGITIHDLKLP